MRKFEEAKRKAALLAEKARERGGKLAAAAKEQTGRFVEATSAAIAEVAEQGNKFLDEQDRRFEESQREAEEKALAEALKESKRLVPLLSVLAQQIKNDFNYAAKLSKQIEEAKKPYEIQKQSYSDSGAEEKHRIAIEKLTAAEAGVRNSLDEHVQQLEQLQIALTAFVKPDEKNDSKLTSILVGRKNKEADNAIHSITQKHQAVRVAIAYGNVQRFRWRFLITTLSSVDSMKKFFEAQPELDNHILEAIGNKGVGIDEDLDYFKRTSKIPTEQEKAYQPVLEYYFHFRKIIAHARVIITKYLDFVEGKEIQQSEIERILDFVEGRKTQQSDIERIVGLMSHMNQHLLALNTCKSTLEKSYTEGEIPLPDSRVFHDALIQEEIGINDFIMKDITPHLPRSQEQHVEERRRLIEQQDRMRIEEQHRREEQEREERERQEREEREQLLKSNRAELIRLKSEISDLERDLDELPSVPQLKASNDDPLQNVLCELKQQVQYKALLETAKAEAPLRSLNKKIDTLKLNVNKLEQGLNPLPAFPEKRPAAQAPCDDSFDAAIEYGQWQQTLEGQINTASRTVEQLEKYVSLLKLAHQKQEQEKARQSKPAPKITPGKTTNSFKLYSAPRPSTPKQKKSAGTTNSFRLTPPPN